MNFDPVRILITEVKKLLVEEIVERFVQPGPDRGRLLGPPGPERSQRNPEQLVQGS
jgi:hypothetical protein